MLHLAVLFLIYLLSGITNPLALRLQDVGLSMGQPLFCGWLCFGVCLTVLVVAFSLSVCPLCVPGGLEVRPRGFMGFQSSIWLRRLQQ